MSKATAAVLALYIPLWLIEGDAVASETALSTSGRGRVPAFTSEMDAILLERGVLPYKTASFGSYNKNIPDRYQMGYLSVAQIRVLYGETFFSKVFETAGKRPWLISPLNHSSKKISGKSFRALYNFAMQKYSDSLRNIRIQREPTPLLSAARQDTANYSSYLRPVPYGKQIVALRTGLNSIPKFVMLDENQKEKTITTPGILNGDAWSLNANWLVWSEFVAGLRFSNQSYTRVIALNLKTQERKIFGSGKRYLSPSINGSADYMAVVENCDDYTQKLHILDFVSGQVVKSFAYTDGSFIISPSWANSNDSLIAIMLAKNAKAIVSISTENGMTRILSPFTSAEINDPQIYHGKVIFSASFSGRDELYLYNPDDSILFQLTTSSYNHRFPSIDTSTRKIYFSDYTLNGYKAVFISEDDIFRREARFSSKTASALADRLNELAGEISLRNTPDSLFQVKPYKRFRNAINIHSWGLISTNDIDERPGLIMSQNLLSTTFLKAGYDWNMDARQGTWFADFTYKGLFPVLQCTYDRSRREFYYSTYPSGNYYVDHLLKFSASVPMNLGRGRFNSGLNPNITFNQFERHFENSLLAGKNTGFGYPSIGVTAWHYLRLAKKDIQPRFGFVFRGYQRINLKEFFGKPVFTALLYTYLPGLFPHHGLRFYAGYQDMTNTNWIMPNELINFPRGEAGYFETNTVCLKADYKFPILYPDLEILRCIYLKRVRGGVFVDYVPHKQIPTEFANSNLNRQFISYGGELTNDVHLFDFPAPVEVGLQCVYLPQQKRMVPQFLFRIDFYNL